MPSKMLMSWTAEKNRWRKTYKKKQYVVFCSDLDIPESMWTKLGSYKAANEWWNKKKQEIESLPLNIPEEIEELLTRVKIKYEYCVCNGFNLQAKLYEKQKLLIEDQIRHGNFCGIADVDPLAYERLDSVKLLSLFSKQNGIDPETLNHTLDENNIEWQNIDPSTAEIITGVKDLWGERLKNFCCQGVVSVGKCIDKWYEMMELTAKATSLVSIKGYCKYFKTIIFNGKKIIDEKMNVSIINENIIEEVYKAIKALPVKEATKKKRFSFFKQFVKYVVENGHINMPKNLKSKKFCFNVELIEKEIPDVSQIKTFVESLPKMLKLIALLTLNTGMNNIDIGKLTFDQIDFNKRTLVRKRIKTSKSKNVPKVKYALWDETFNLLIELKANGGSLVLLDNNKPLYIDQIDGEKIKIYDRIKVMWRDFFKRIKNKPKFTIKDLRFFAGDLLRINKDFRLYHQAFLGHSPKTVSEKYYSSNEDVSEACKYLHSLFYT